MAKPARRPGEDDDAVRMLLGLSQGDGSDEAAGGAARGTPRVGQKRGPPPPPAARSYPHLTAKGEQRLGPGDNRVRPPKAATKLLPEAKWRHIRLPDVESALEGEDWVVMWAQFKHPSEQTTRATLQANILVARSAALAALCRGSPRAWLERNVHAVSPPSPAVQPRCPAPRQRDCSTSDWPTTMVSACPASLKSTLIDP